MISFQLEKHGICHWNSIWIWIHIVCRGFNALCNIRISKFFTHKKLIWTVDFKFGVHKLSVRFYWWRGITLRRKLQVHSWQLWRNERGKLLYPCWDNYLEFSRFWILNTFRPSLFWSHLFFRVLFSYTKIRQSLIFFELLICMYNCDFGSKDRTNIILPLIGT